MHAKAILQALGLLLAAPALHAGVAGRVVNSQGQPVEGAQVQVIAEDQSAVTDARGQFELPQAEPPLTILVHHPRFYVPTVEVPAGSSARLEIVLQAKQEIYEEVVVSASRGEAAPPLSIAATLVAPDDAPSPPATLTELVSVVPGVAENGQGGVFQTYSVRGISRQRVLTLVSGMRIVSERRAGVSASFLDPGLMQSVDVLRGPSSSYYGSGALGGVVQLFPRTFDGLAVETGYRSQGDESFQTVGWGAAGWSVGLAHRHAGRSETPDGDPLFSGFDQYSGVVEKRWTAADLEYQVQAIGAAGRDIEKPNTDFPARTTVYPEEDHGLFRFSVRSPGSWRVEAFAHPNELQTRVVELDRDRRSLLRNEAFDFGVNYQRELGTRGGVSSRFGIDWFARRAVTADEVVAPIVGRGPEIRQRSLDGAEEDEAGVYGALEWHADQVTLLAGGRFAFQRQTNAGAPETDDTAWSGFAGVVVPIGSGVEFTANAGTGLRFPSLSERFFSGNTGRGEVIGNPGLEPERSLSLDLGARFYGESLFLSAYVFRNEIDDYIERVETAPDTLTFVNLTSGTLEGLELEGLYRFDERWTLTFGGHTIEGRDDAGSPLADVPSNRLQLGGRFKSDRWGAEARWEHRESKDDPGSGEKPIPAAELLSASVSLAWQNGLTLTVSGRNLLDERYFNSADRKVTLAAGRSVGVSIGWSR